MALTTVAPSVGGTGLTAPGTSGNVLTSNGTAWTSTANTGAAKAWVNFNGTGTVAIRGSFNVSSVTDNGTGTYTVNFTTSMPNANYAISGTRGTAGVAGVNMTRHMHIDTTSLTTSQFVVSTGFSFSTSFGLEDADFVALSIFSS